MFNNVRKGLKAWVRFDGNNNAVAGSLIFQKDKPKVGKWKEYQDVNLCCPVTDCTPNYGAWRVVTGGAAGDGTVLVDDLQDQDFTIIGPNDDFDDGWVYITKYFPNGATLLVNYEFTSFDEGVQYDRPIYFTSATQPTGEPDNTTSRVEESPASGNWEILVPKGQWFAIGIYSTDSCCGRGFLSVGIEENELYTVPGEWFLYDTYSPAFDAGSITFPNHEAGEGDLNPNDVGQVDGDTLTQIYINPFNAAEEDQVQAIASLVGTDGQTILTQGSNSVAYGYTSQSFEIEFDELVNVFADNVYGNSVPGSISILNAASENFNTVDPITIQIKLNS